MLNHIRSMPRAAWVLFGGTFINRFGTFVMPFLALYLTRQGFSIARAGLAVGAYGAGLVCASVLGGHLADRMGRRNTIALSMFASAAAMLTLSQARAYSSIVALTWAAGLASELYRPASHALIADLVPEDQRVVAFGIYRFAVNLGFAAGPATAGFLAEHSFF
jgi:MFS family permease